METRLIWANFASANLKRTMDFYTAIGFGLNGEQNAEDGISLVFGKQQFVLNFFTPERLSDPRNGAVTLSESGNEVIFSISAENRDEVTLWHDRVREAGGTVISSPHDYEQGYNFVFADPDGHKFNVLFWPGM